MYEWLVHESGGVACETGFWFLDARAATYVEDASHITCPVPLVAGAATAIGLSGSQAGEKSRNASPDRLDEKGMKRTV